MGAIKDFSKDTLVYGLGAGVKKFIGLFLLPFYTKALSPSDYGVLDTLGTLIFFITAVFNFGLDTATG
jgi:O-antigen/teichoic acid export membrane protein